MVERHYTRWFHRDSYHGYGHLLGQSAPNDREEKVRSMFCIRLEIWVSIRCSLPITLADRRTG
jgi:hypothetical protein